MALYSGGAAGEDHVGYEAVGIPDEEVLTKARQGHNLSNTLSPCFIDS